MEPQDHCKTGNVMQEIKVSSLNYEKKKYEKMKKKPV